MNNLERARTWLREQVMDMGDCEEVLSKSLATVLDTVTKEERERAAQCADRVANMKEGTRKALGELGAGQVIAATIIANAIRGASGDEEGARR